MKLIASIDDGCVHDLRAAELMAKYNIPTIFYWPYALEKSQNVGRVGKFLTKDQCVEISKKFEIGSHTVNHCFLTKINLQQASNEIFDSRKLWQDLTGQEINSFCYPRGYSSVMLQAMVKNAGYSNARSTIIGHLNKGDNPYFEPTTLHVGIDRIEYKIDNQNVSWELYGRHMLEKATEDSIYHIFFHTWEIERENDWDALELLIKEIL